MSNIDNGADYGKMYLFLGQLKDDWMKKADANNDGEVTAGEFAWFISESNEWDTDTLGNRPDNDIIHNFFSNMLDINNTSQHYLDKAEMGKVFDQDRNNDGTLDWKQFIQEFANSIGLSLGDGFDDKTLDDITDIAGAFENHSYVNWNINSDGYSLAYNSSGYTISGLIKDSKNMTFSAKEKDGTNLSNVKFVNGVLAFKAQKSDTEKTYTITITATGEDGLLETKDITVTIGAKPEENPLDKMTWDTEETFEIDSTNTKNFNVATNIPEGTLFEIVDDKVLTSLSIDNNGKLTFKPDNDGTFIIQVKATNGVYSKIYATTIIVTESQQEKVVDTTEWTTNFTVNYQAPMTKTDVVSGCEYGPINPATNYPGGTKFTIPSETLPKWVNSLSCDLTTGAVIFVVGELAEDLNFSFEMQAILKDGTVVNKTINVKITMQQQEDPEVKWESTSFSLDSGETRDNLATVSSKTGELNFIAKSNNLDLGVAFYPETGNVKLTAPIVSVVTTMTFVVTAVTKDGKSVSSKTFTVTILPTVKLDPEPALPYFGGEPDTDLFPIRPNPSNPDSPLKFVEGFDVLY